LHDALELGNGMADEMRKDAERWEQDAAEKKRLEAPAGGQKYGDECQQRS
jgi:hypothetical protein